MTEITKIHDAAVGVWNETLPNLNDFSNMLGILRSLVRAHCNDNRLKRDVSRDIISVCDAISRLQHRLENLIDTTK